MRRPTRRLIGVVFVLSAALVVGGTSASVAAPQMLEPSSTAGKTAGAPAVKPKVTATPTKGRRVAAAQAEIDLPRPVHGSTAVRLLGDDLDEAAALNEMPVDYLVDLLTSDPTAWVDTRGAVFFKDPVARTAAAGATAAASAPLNQTFALHSKTGSKHTIFLDFDGSVVTGSRWNDEFPSMPSSQPAWDPSGNGAAFTDAELTSIQTIWESVAEDYAPFDVDVTTADPGAAAINRSSTSDDVFGARVLVTPGTGTSAALCNSQCGGVAYLGAYGATYGGAAGDGYGYQQPAWVFPHLLGPNSPKAIAEAASHEAGHQFGLNHDGNPSEGYDAGHGAWAPIMGVGYDHPISQWSKGDYAGANNQQDDLTIIQDVLGLRPDSAGGSVAQPDSFPTGTSYISSRTDVDVYLLGTCSGTITVGADPLVTAANLDIKLTLLSATGTTVATADPASAQSSVTVASGMNAQISQSVTAGTYYVAVDGTGNGPWSTGYDDYGSIGAYTMSKTGNCNGAAPAGVPSAPTSTTATADPLDPSVTVTWAAPSSNGAGGAVTGYLLTRSDSDQVVQVPATTTSYTWTGLAYSTGYTFTVTALNGNGAGTLASVPATTGNGTVKPGAPLNPMAAWDSLTQKASFGWSAPSSSGSAAIQDYYLYVDGTLIGAAPATYNAVSLSPFSPGTHTLAVSAWSSVGEGPQASTTVIVPARPANDAFAQRTTLSGVSGTVTGDNTESSAESGEVAPASATRATPGGASLWYSWTAPASGPATISTTSTVTNRDTILSVYYTASTVSSLSYVAGNDEPAGGGHLASVTFNAIAGVTYAVAVDGYRTLATGVGQFGLSWSGTETGAKATTTDLSAVVTGRSVTLTAAVTASVGKPEGMVVWREGSTILDYGDVWSGNTSPTLTLDDLTRGTHTYSAQFVPDSSDAFVGSLSQSRAVTIAATSTSTTLEATAEAQTVTFDATVTAAAGTAAGTVELREGSTLVGTGTVSGGHTVVSVVDVSPGSHSYTATFVPADADRYAGSASSATQVTVPPPAPAKATTTTLAGSVDGRSASLTATVTATGATPTGSIQFLDGGTVIGTRTLSGGTASYVATDLTKGTHHFTAAYVPANPAAYESSASADRPLTIAATTTSSTLTGTVSGRTVTLQVAVSPTAAGTTEIREGGVLKGTVTLSSGTGQLVLSDVVAGSHTYTATYLPADDLRFATSTSADRTLSVSPTTTATALGSSIAFHRVTLSATVTATEGTVAGSVTFREGGAVVGVSTVTDGVAALVLDDVTTGDHTYTATFAPTDSTSYVGSTSAEHTATVAATATTTDLAASASGRTVTLAGTVTTANGALSGSIEFREGSTVVGSATLADGAAGVTLSDVAPGPHGYTATFVPTGTSHAGSTSATRTATARATTATTLAAEVDGRSVTLDAEVTGAGTPAGSVEFRDGSSLVGTVALTGGAASLTLALVTPGEHSYTATFVATAPASYAGSVSDPQAVVVDKVATATALAVSVSGRSVTLTATVTAPSGTLSGTVEFRDGATLIGSRSLSSGSAAFTRSSEGFGAHSYTATYVPLGTVHAGSASAAEAATVLGTTTTTLTATVTGRSVTLTATVDTDGTSPAGSVWFYRDGSFVTGAAVAGGAASYTITNVQPGNYSYTATFRPTGTAHAESSSPTVTATVAKVASTTALVAGVSDGTVTLDATVTVAEGSVGGQVQFREGETLVGTVNVGTPGTARLTIPAAGPGDHTYVATFVPSAASFYAGSVSPARTVSASSVSTTTGLAATVSAQTVTLTATLAAGSGSIAGAVEFYDGSTLLDTVPVSGATVVLQVSDVAPGSHTYTATYVPTGTTHAGSTSPARTVTVGVRATTTALTVDVDVRTVTLNAAVAAGARHPGGTVVFKEGSTVLGTVDVEDGAASLTLTLVEPWAHVYTATFVPSDTAAYAGSVSLTRIITVAPIVTTTEVTAAYVGNLKVNLTALVTSASASSSGSLFGTVEFREGDTLVASTYAFGGSPVTVSVLDVSPGEHTYRVTFVPVSYSAVYYGGSVSSARTVTVDPVPTTTTLTATADGDTVTLQAGLNAAIEGDIVFREGSDVIRTVALVDRSAGLVLEDVATGAHTYTATFVPADTDWYAGSVSPSRTAVVKAVTTTTLSGSADQRTVTLSAEVSGAGAHAGDVVFRDGADVVGTVPLASGTAVLTLSNVFPGDHDYRATFVPASSDVVVGSASEAHRVTVDPIPTTTALTADVDGRAVTLTATITGTSGAPAGSVEFREGGTLVQTVAVAVGAASAVLTGVTPGPHTYRASFVPANAATFVASASDPATATVAPIATETDLEVTVDGRTVALDAVVTSTYATPAGDVVFREGDTVMETVEVVDGGASLELTGVEPGEHTYAATFVPADPVRHSGSASDERSVTVAAVVTETTLAAVADVRTVTLDAEVTSDSGTPAGEVVFREGDTEVGTVELEHGSASLELTGIDPGEHTYTATFVPSDEVRFAGSASEEQKVTVAPIVTLTELAADVEVRTVTLDADVTADSGTPVGDVVFRDGDAEVGTVELEDGVASLELTGVDPGEHAFTASFVPSDEVRFAGSASEEQKVTVAPIVTTTQLTSGVDVRTVTLDAAVSADSGTPAGDVVFRDGDTEVGTVELEDGAASLELTGVDPGGHTYTATFVPADEVRFAGSASGEQTETVAPIVTTTELTPTADGTTVTLDVAVTGASGSPAGEVVLREGGDELDTLTVDDGHTRLEIEDVDPGEHTYTASYVPSDPVTYAASDSGDRSVVVGRFATTTELETSVDERTVTFTATVSTDVGALDGEVQFGYSYLGDVYDVFRTVPLVDGTATFTTKGVAPGEHDFGAKFVPSDTAHASSVGERTVTVSPDLVRTVTTVESTVVGRTVTFHVATTSSEGAVDGSVTIWDGENLIDFAGVDGGVGEVRLTNVAVGRHHYTAELTPSDSWLFAGSTSDVHVVDVAAPATVTELTATATGSTVALAVTVTSHEGTPFGTVEIFEGDTSLYNVYTDGDGRADHVVTGLVGGTHTYRAEFTPYGNGYQGSTSPDATAIVAPTETTTTVTAQRSGRSVTLSASVSAPIGNPAGTVSFRDGPTVVATTDVAGGAASTTVASVATGSHDYVAEFVPEVAERHAGSEGSTRLTMTASDTSTALTVRSSLSTVTFTATVSSPDGTPTGTVEITEGDTVVATGALGIPIDLPEVALGDHTYRATYLPTDDSFAGSRSGEKTVRVTDVPPAVATTTTLTASAVRRTVTLAAGVTADGAPEGSVQFTEDGVVVGSVEVATGIAILTRTAVTAGQHAYAATFVPADAADFESSASPTRQVTVSPTVTATAMTGSLSGSTATLKVDVTGTDGIVPLGSVVILEGSSPISTVAVVAGRATYVVGGVSVGAHSFQARFLPADGSQLGSESALVSLRVAAPTPPPVVVPPAVSSVASKVKLTAPKSAKAKARPVVKIKVTRSTAAATGKVVLTVGKKKVTLTLKAGAATYKLPKLKKGTLKLAVSYAGNATTKASSAKATIKVR